LFDPQNSQVLADASMYCSQVTLPQWDVNQLEYRHVNRVNKIAGSASVTELTVTVYDVLDPQIFDAVYYWYQGVWNPQDGLIGYAGRYKGTATITQYDVMGMAVRSWEMEGVWPKSVNLGDLSYDDAAVLTFEATFSVDIIYPTSNNMGDINTSNYVQANSTPANPQLANGA
jgi:hypothetical protein